MKNPVSIFIYNNPLNQMKLIRFGLHLRGANINYFYMRGILIAHSLCVDFHTKVTLHIFTKSLFILSFFNPTSM